ncbi:type II toxin-antitoxin system RelB/DinJ family antitoxin [Candidatus Roizmanbacteria bacterium]|nr:type II toxin-antitoxin system RelB/DinJ family antitoxin [Candidatus Roizmanbacteria bacterium]
MNTAVINIKTEKKLKKQVQGIASDLGVSLSALINVYLRQLVRTRRLELDLGEEPSNYLRSVIRKANENYRKGKTSPAFRTGEEAVKWLEKQGV